MEEALSRVVSDSHRRMNYEFAMDTFDPAALQSPDSVLATHTRETRFLSLATHVTRDVKAAEHDQKPNAQQEHGCRFGHCANCAIRVVGPG